MPGASGQEELIAVSRQILAILNTCMAESRARGGDLSKCRKNWIFCGSGITVRSCMGHPRLEQDSEIFFAASWRWMREHQPDVLAWLLDHSGASSIQVAIEMSWRTFEACERWGMPLGVIARDTLDLTLASQIPTIDPRLRWMTEPPIALMPSDRLAVGRLLRALVSVIEAQHEVPTPF